MQIALVQLGASNIMRAQARAHSKTIGATSHYGRAGPDHSPAAWWQLPGLRRLAEQQLPVAEQRASLRECV